MLDIPIDHITKDTIKTLYDNSVQESRVLDYKRNLPGRTDEERKEFLADVTSFANASGGHLIIGIEDEDGRPNGTPGLSIVDTDAEKLRLENMIRACVEPRLQNVTVQTVPVDDGLKCLVIRIPKSWNSPHAVRHHGYYVWYSRNSAGKYPLDIPELKSAFIYGDSISERVRQFRLERISKITANEAPVQLHDEITFVLHTIPLQAMGSTDQVDLQRLTSLTRPADLYSAGFQQRFNVDGLLIHNVADGRNNRYKQVFRSGAIEYAHAQGPKIDRRVMTITVRGTAMTSGDELKLLANPTNRFQDVDTK